MKISTTSNLLIKWKTVCFTFFLLVFGFINNAQVIHPPHGDVFKDDIVPRIDMRINPDSLKWILDPVNKESDQTFKSDFFFDNGQKKDTFFNIGFGLRGNTSRNSPKKSF
ncbi:MAG: hypothetical protein IPP06_03185 [Saprospiraceae bacterium]|nr:hypothetical protein [Candidatus Vicinibacter affinis]